MSMADEIKFEGAMCSYPQEVAELINVEGTTMPIVDLAGRSWDMFSFLVGEYHANQEIFQTGVFNGNGSRLREMIDYNQETKHRIDLMRGICFVAGAAAIANCTPDDFR